MLAWHERAPDLTYNGADIFRQAICDCIQEKVKIERERATADNARLAEQEIISDSTSASANPSGESVEP